MRTCTIKGCGDKIYCSKMCSKHYQRYRKHGDPLAGRTFEGEPQQWIKNHQDFTEDKCLIWPFARNKAGYAVIGGNFYDGKNRMIYVHRIMLEHKLGPAPEGHVARHSVCGNGHLGCVNPAHLTWGTQKENINDMVSHGTSNRGSRCTTSKLKESDVIEIMYKLKSGVKQIDIANEYYVDYRTISQINTGRRWGWLTSPNDTL